MEIEISGPTLKRLREQNELSVRALAGRIHLPIHQVQEIERGCALLPEETVYTLSKILGVAPDDLYAQPPDPEKTWWIWTDTQRRTYRERILGAYKAYLDVHHQRPTEILLDTHVAKQVNHHVPGFLLSCRYRFDARKVGFRCQHQTDRYPVLCSRALIVRLARLWDDALSAAPGLIWPVLFAQAEGTDPVDVIFGSPRVARLFAEIIDHQSSRCGDQSRFLEDSHVDLCP